MNTFLIVRKILISIVAILILTWAFFQNQLFGKLIILPFWVCSIAILGESIFTIFQKEKIAKIFSTIYRISFFCYVFGFLAYTIYYSITKKSYSLLIIAFLSLLFVIPFFRKTFSKKK